MQDFSSFLSFSFFFCKKPLTPWTETIYCKDIQALHLWYLDMKNSWVRFSAWKVFNPKMAPEVIRMDEVTQGGGE